MPVPVDGPGPRDGGCLLMQSKPLGVIPTPKQQNSDSFSYLRTFKTSPCPWSPFLTLSGPKPQNFLGPPSQSQQEGASQAPQRAPVLPPIRSSLGGWAWLRCHAGEMRSFLRAEHGFSQNNTRRPGLRRQDTGTRTPHCLARS